MIKSKNKLCIFISSIFLSSVIIVATVFIPTINQESIFMPKAEALGGCQVSYSNHTATNLNCFRGRHVVRVGSAWQTANWATKGDLSISLSYTNETAYGSDAHEFSSETTYQRKYKVY